MPRLFKLPLYLLLALLGLTLLAAAAVWLLSNAKLRKTHQVSVRSVPALGTEAIGRGKHIAASRGCTDCHGADLGGATVFDNGAMGRVDGPNLTRGAGGLPADYSDLDFVRAIRHGVARDGRGLFLMPAGEYKNFSDGDMAALVSYLKSLPPVARTTERVALGPVARVLVATGKVQLAADVIDHANVQPAVVIPGVTADYGRYLGAACTGCHGENYSGGKIAIGPPDWPPAANLTPASDGRIKAWSEAEFVRAMRTGKRPDGSEINPVMPRAFGNMDDTELRALFAFLKTLPAAATGVR